METHQLEFFNEPPPSPQKEERVPLQQKEIEKILGNLGVPSTPASIEATINALKKVSAKYHQQKEIKLHNPGYQITASWMSLADSERPDSFTESQWRALNGKRKEIWKILNDTTIPKGNA